MAVTIRIAHYKATIDGYKWDSSNDALVEMLNAMLDPSGASGADPAPDVTAAQMAVDRAGGEIVDVGERLEYVDGRIY